MEKRDTNFGQNGCETWEIIQLAIDMFVYIFLMGKKKENFFEKCLSVRLPVREICVH